MYPSSRLISLSDWLMILARYLIVCCPLVSARPTQYNQPGNQRLSVDPINRGPSLPILGLLFPFLFFILTLRDHLKLQNFDW
ncbi:hypothetical protein F5Y19DRAFT_438812 [Xylariaceae sp. FL1651]|nr:hypothetical protein F5Y19DRAFT_438812 [Xylariaceae sp. FL1651]